MDLMPFGIFEQASYNVGGKLRCDREVTYINKLYLRVIRIRWVPYITSVYYKKESAMLVAECLLTALVFITCLNIFTTWYYI